MVEIDKYLKIAKKVIIKPEDHNIEEKIIERLSSVDENDKTLLDVNFMDYMKKSNSRLYLFSESIKNKPGKFIFILASIFLFLGFIAFIIRRSSAPQDDSESNKEKGNVK